MGDANTTRAFRAARRSRGPNRVLPILLIAAVIRPILESQQQPPPKFRSGTQLVTVAAIVTDRNDNPVNDLTQNDFVITADGRPQAMARFEVVSIPANQPRSGEPIAFSDITDNGDASRPSRHLALILDDLHLVESDIVPIKRVAKTLVDGLSADDSVAVVYVGRSDLGHDFSRDHRRAVASVMRLGEALGFGLDAGPAKRYARSYLDSTLFVFENVLTSLASSMSSRRMVVYLGNGFRAAPEQDSYLQAIFKLARREDIPIYTIDPRGLVLAEDAIRGGIGAIDTPGARQAVVGTVKSQQEVLQTIAFNTGGRAFVNRSNPAAAADEILRETGHYYLLTFYPEPYAPDGKFHRVQVKVTRAGVAVRAREGYLAGSPETGSADLSARVKAALAAGSPVAELPLKVVATPVAWNDKGIITVVTAHIDAIPSPAAPDTLLLSMRALDREGKVRAVSDREVSPTGPADRNGRDLDDVILIPRAATTLRVAVASKALAKVGSVHVSLPRLTSGTDAWWMSGVALGIDGESFDNLPSAIPNGLLPFKPTTSREWDSAETLRAFVRLSWPRKDRARGAMMSIEGQQTRVTEPVPIKLAPASRDRRDGVIDVARPLKDLAAGDYVLTVTILPEHGDETSRSVPFRIRTPK